MMTKALGLILLFGILTVAVIPALGQDQPTKGTATNTSTANTPTAKASPNPCDAVNKGGSPLEDKDQGKVIGVVSAPSADASSTATLTLEGQGDNGNRYVVSQQNFQPCGASATANTERFAYEQVVDPGTYDAILTSPDYATQTTTVPVPKGKTVRKDFNFPKAAISTNIWLVLVPIIFLLSIWFVRWNNIAVPTRRELQAQVKETLAQVQDSPQKKSGVIDELATVEKQLEERKSVFWDWILWSRGLELAGWKAIHNAQIALIDDASPERVDARLLSAEQELVQSGKPSASGLALRIKSQFDNPANSTRETRKQLLKEALSYLNSYAETDFGGLTSWQNKAFWLTSVGVLLIVALTVTEKHGSLFMAGAAGGFLSRMMRQLKRADVPSDYGASWATLFLSPISGALAGWFGVLLIMLLADPKVGIFAGPLQVVNWNSPNVAAVLGVGFAFGFSERLFDGIMSQLEATIDKKKEASEKGIATTTQSTGAGAEPGAAQHGSKQAPGRATTQPLPGFDLSNVTQVELAAVSGTEEHTVENLVKGTDSITFTNPADTSPGDYKILLVDPSGRKDTQKTLTVAAKT